MKTEDCEDYVAKLRDELSKFIVGKLAGLTSEMERKPDDADFILFLLYDLRTATEKAIYSLEPHAEADDGGPKPGQEHFDEAGE